MVLTLMFVYGGGWAITTAVTYATSRRLADRDMTPLNSLCFSLLAGLVWPLMIVGMMELSSVAVYSTAKSMRHDSEIPQSWLGRNTLPGAAIPLG